MKYDHFSGRFTRPVIMTAWPSWAWQKQRPLCTYANSHLKPDHAGESHCFYTRQARFVIHTTGRRRVHYDTFTVTIFVVGLHSTRSGQARARWTFLFFDPVKLNTCTARCLCCELKCIFMASKARILLHFDGLQDCSVTK